MDEVLKTPQCKERLQRCPRRYVLGAVREIIEERRQTLREGRDADVSHDSIISDLDKRLARLMALSLRPVINATGVVVHTNLGRSALCARALDNIQSVARGYCTLEYDIEAGKRGKRYSHLVRLLRETTGAEDGIAVNNNAAAVLLCLAALARGKEVIVSRGELVEIGGSFRVPEVMAQSGAILREVGATNKTHLKDYEGAINENTALILKVHQSNFRIRGFTTDVSVAELAELGRRRGLPVMYDMGSGCLVDLKPHGILDEPSVADMVQQGADVVTFSGDKILGGPQAGIIVGKAKIIKALQGHPLLRAIRIDKLSLAALEPTLAEYADPWRAEQTVPTLRMLLEKPESIRARAERLAAAIKEAAPGVALEVVPDESYSGGGALPEHALPTFAVAIDIASPNGLEEALRKGNPAVIGRIKGDRLLLDARTIFEEEIATVANCIKQSIST